MSLGCGKQKVSWRNEVHVHVYQFYGNPGSGNFPKIHPPTGTITLEGNNGNNLHVPDLILTEKTVNLEGEERERERGRIHKGLLVQAAIDIQRSAN